MKARIYQPAKNAMQSGKANIKKWILEYESSDIRRVEPVMGWTSSYGTEQQIKLKFSTLEEAVNYAKRHHIAYVVLPPKKTKTKIRSYAENFTN